MTNEFIEAAYLSRSVHTDVTAGTTTYVVSFAGGMQPTDDIEVWVNGIEAAAATVTWLSDSTLQLNGYTPVEGDDIEFRRVSPKDDNPVDLEAGKTIRAVSLMKNFRHVLQVAQEAWDRSYAGSAAASEAAIKAMSERFIYKVDSFNELREVPYESYKAVYLTGYVAPCDGGHGLFLWKPDSVEDDDSTNVAAVTGVTIGRFVRHVDALVSAPRTETGKGVPGQWAVDAAFFYLCVGLNTWVRFAITAGNTWTNVDFDSYRAEMLSSGTTMILTMNYDATVDLESITGLEFTVTGSVSGARQSGSITGWDELVSFEPNEIMVGFSDAFVAGETLTLSYSGGVGLITNTLGESLPEFSGMYVVNNTADVQDYSDIALWLGFDGTISVPTGSDGTYTATSGEYPPSAVYDIRTFNPDPETGPVLSLDSAVVAAGDKSLKMVSSENDQGRWLEFTTAPLTGSGRIGLWYKYGFIYNPALLFQFFNDEFPWSGITVTVDSAYGHIGIKYDVNMGADDATETSGSVQCDTTALESWDTNWHYYEFAWDVADFGLKVYKDGVLLNTFAGWGAGMTAALVNGSIGKTYNYLNMHSYHMDNFVVSTDKDRNLYALANRSISPRVG